MDTEVYRNLRNSVCVLGVGTSKLWNYGVEETKPSQLSFTVIGTGFLIQENLVATNRHVLNALQHEDKDWITAVFISPNSDGDLSFSYRKLGYRLALTSGPEFSDKTGHTFGTDIALIELEANDNANTIHKPVEFGKKEDIQIGKAIGVCGYIHGNELLSFNSSDASTVRFAPMLMQGHISGIAPFDNLPGHELNLILTDMTNGGGLSGSPLVTETGKVIGIHCAGRSEAVLSPDGNGKAVVRHVTQGIGFAVPFPEEKVVKVISSFQKIVEKHKSQQ